MHIVVPFLTSHSLLSRFLFFLKEDRERQPPAGQPLVSGATVSRKMTSRYLGSLSEGNNIYNFTTKFCMPIPPSVNSNGIWKYIENGRLNPLEASLPRLELQIIAAFSVTQAAHYVLKRLGMPMIVSQIVAGLILRQAALPLNDYYKFLLFSDTSLGVLDLAATFGCILFLFLMGVKMDVSMIIKTGKISLFTGMLALLIPFILGVVAVENVSKFWNLDRQDRMKLLVVTTTHSLSPFPVISCLIDNLQILNSELGRLGLSCALVSEMLGIILARSAISIRIAYTRSARLALQNLAFMLAYATVVFFAIRPAMFWVVKQTPEGKPVKSLYVHNIIMLALGAGFLTFLFGQYALIGPFILGLAVPDGPPLGSALVDKLDPIVSGLLVPIVVASSSIRANLLEIKLDDNLMKSTAVVVTVIILAKFAASSIPPLFCKVPKRDAFALALIMSSKGIVEITSYNVSREVESITERMFGLLVGIILVTAIIVPILVKILYDPSRKYAGYQKRNIMHSEVSGELRILACIYRPDNIPAIINFLQASCSTGGNPVAVFVLHLINLSGRAVPLFISHKMQTKTVSNRSYSENVILSFKFFEENNCGTANVDPFTAISPTKFMHEDICMLALDKLASIVVLPFHRNWFIDGSIESDDNTKRSLNRCVLERAPCSVGILVDRGYLGQFISRELSRGSYFCVAIIFIGGSDDREALSLAKRMSRNASISLTVIRFIAKSHETGTDWEKVLDTEVLKDIKPENNLNQRVKYVVEMVNDGQETMSIIEFTAEKYDLIIVGRRNNTETQQTSGLDSFREFPELGVVGNFLVTEDLPRRYSVLVVQQQQTAQ